MLLRTLLSFALALGLSALALTVGDEEEEAKPKPPLKKVPLPEDKPAGVEPKGPPTPPMPPMPPGKLPGFDPGMPDAPSGEPGTGTPKPKGKPKPKDGAGTPAPGPGAKEDDDEDSTAGAYFVKLPELAREAAAAKNPVLKEFYGKFTVAHDRLSAGNAKPLRVTPLPLLWGKDRYPAEFGVVPLTDEDTMQEAVALTLKKVRGIEHFEAIAVEEVLKLLALKGGDTPPLRERLEAAEKVLVAAYFFHDSAREQNKRRGKSWDAVRAAVTDRLA